MELQQAIVNAVPAFWKIKMTDEPILPGHKPRKFVVRLGHIKTDTSHHEVHSRLRLVAEMVVQLWQSQTAVVVYSCHHKKGRLVTFYPALNPELKVTLQAKGHCNKARLIFKWRDHA